MTTRDKELLKRLEIDLNDKVIALKHDMETAKEAIKWAKADFNEIESLTAQINIIKNGK